MSKTATGSQPFVVPNFTTKEYSSFFLSGGFFFSECLEKRLTNENRCIVLHVSYLHCSMLSSRPSQLTSSCSLSHGAMTRKQLSPTYPPIT